MLGIIFCVFFFILGTIKLISDVNVALSLYLVASLFYMGYSIYNVATTPERLISKFSKINNLKETFNKDKDSETDNGEMPDFLK